MTAPTFTNSTTTSTLEDTVSNVITFSTFRSKTSATTTTAFKITEIAPNTHLYYGSSTSAKTEITASDIASGVYFSGSSMASNVKIGSAGAVSAKLMWLPAQDVYSLSATDYKNAFKFGVSDSTNWASPLDADTSWATFSITGVSDSPTLTSISNVDMSAGQTYTLLPKFEATLRSKSNVNDVDANQIPNFKITSLDTSKGVLQKYDTSTNQYVSVAISDIITTGSDYRWAPVNPDALLIENAIKVKAIDPENLLSSTEVPIHFQMLNNPPTALSATLSATWNTTGTIDYIINNFTDSDGDTLTYSATLADNSTLPSWLSVANGKLSGNPSPTEIGNLAVKLIANDGKGGTANATLTLTIGNNINDLPIITNSNATQTIANNSQTSISGLSVSEPENQNLTVTLNAIHGTLSATNSNSVLTGDGSSELVLTGTVANINTVLNTLKYTANSLLDDDQISVIATDSTDIVYSNIVLNIGEDDVSITSYNFSDNKASDYSALENPINITGNASDVSINSSFVISKSGSANTLTLSSVSGNIEGDLITFDSGSLKVESGVIKGTSGNDLLVGSFTASSDNIRGYAGNDALIGNSGADYLNGGAGNDLLNGGAGKDVLVGGAGNDTFKFASGDSGTTASTADIIKDLATGDKIDLSSLGSTLNVIKSGVATTLTGTGLTLDSTNLDVFVAKVSGKYYLAYESTNAQTPEVVLIGTNLTGILANWTESNGIITIA